VEESVESHRKDSRSDEATSEKIKVKVEKAAKQTRKAKTNSPDLFVNDSNHEVIELFDTDRSSTPSPPLTRHQARRLEKAAMTRNDMEDVEMVLPLKRRRDDGHAKSKPKRPKIRRAKSKATVNSSDDGDDRYGDDKGDDNEPKGNIKDKGKHVLRITKDSEPTEVGKGM
jgi:hypothetical protein